MNKMIFAVILVLAATDAAWARRDQAREGRQNARIAEGVKSGELNHAEAKRLRRGQHHVDNAQKKAMADGTMTDAEKAKIEKMQDVQSKRIYRQKHDGQQRGDHATAPTEGAPSAQPSSPAAAPAPSENQ